MQKVADNPGYNSEEVGTFISDQDHKKALTEAAGK